MSNDMDRARRVADAVLYEGYLLYPYRATSSKNQSRWQFGVLGPPGAADSGVGEDDSLSAQFLASDVSDLELTVRFLQVQHRQVEQTPGDGSWVPVDRLETSSGCWLTWDEAVEVERCFVVPDTAEPVSLPVVAPAHLDVEAVDGARLVRRREAVCGRVDVDVESGGPVDVVTVTVRNTGAAATGKGDAVARSMIGAHVLARTSTGRFLSMLEPPPQVQSLVDNCRQHRCFPVLAGRPGHDRVLLISPIILYDHPDIAEQSAGALYDSTEIDEILTLRVMTMTDGEKREARATDPLAARIIDQCDGMTAEAMLGLHGVCRDPRGVAAPPNSVVVDGVRVGTGSHVRLCPSRRADAQDMFVAGKTARVTDVHEDLDGAMHVAVVVDDDPAADLHDWYGRYLYFSPEEIQPLPERRPT